MSSELNAILSKVAAEDNRLTEKEFEDGKERYKSLLLKIAKEKKLDSIMTVEGTDQRDLNMNIRDLEVLESAHLVKSETKYTHRNMYRQYELTSQGIELAEKLSKET